MKNLIINNFLKTHTLVDNPEFKNDNESNKH